MRLRAVLTLAVLFVSLIIANSSTTTRAGEIIDYLPEVVTARSLGAYIAAAFINGARASDCDNAEAAESISEHFLYDENGVEYAPSQIAEIAQSITCLFRPTSSETPFPSALERAQNSIDVIQGNKVLLFNGNELDGTKQSVRVYSLLRVNQLFLAEVVDPQGRLLTTSTEDACRLIIEATGLGNTIEMRFVAFVSLTGLLNSTIETGGRPLCHRERFESDEELIEAAKLGDLEAAVNLGLRWTNRNESEFLNISMAPDGESSILDLEEFLDQRLNFIGLQILENTEIYPFVSTAFASSTFILYFAEYFIRFFDESEGQPN